jgi:hypothetical protein
MDTTEHTLSLSEDMWEPEATMAMEIDQLHMLNGLQEGSRRPGATGSLSVLFGGGNRRAGWSASSEKVIEYKD